MEEKEVEIEEEITLKQVKENIRLCYPRILEVLEKYLDMPQDYYKIVATWIIGTYFHREFYSFPYLFFNAMRGSGKTRLLKLVTKLSDDGQLLASLTEAVMFRSTGTLGIDEFEGLGRKENNALRELLNASYKRGTKILRMKKKKTKDGEDHVIDTFEPYRPIVMANINGMEEVLGDRCITLILEKSDHPIKTKLIELFDDEDLINYTLNKLQIVRTFYTQNIKKGVEWCMMYSCQRTYKNWNKYISMKSTPLCTTTYPTLLYTTIHTTHHPTQHEHVDTKITEMFDTIYGSKIYGRNLELFMPLFIVAEMLGENELKDMIRMAKEITQEKKQEEGIESRDVMVIDFVSQKAEGMLYHPVKMLYGSFREFAGVTTEDDWLTSQWFGLALKRLGLVISKKRKNHGMEVMLNVVKAQNKIIMFK